MRCLPALAVAVLALAGPHPGHLAWATIPPTVSPLSPGDRTPQIEKVTPDLGPRSGGIPILISGTELDLVTSVTIGGVAAPIIARGGAFYPPDYLWSFMGWLQVELPGYWSPGPVDLVLMRGSDPVSTTSFTYLNDDPLLTAVSPQYVYGNPIDVLLQGYQLDRVIGVDLGTGGIIPVTLISPTMASFRAPTLPRKTVNQVRVISLLTPRGLLSVHGGRTFSITYPGDVPVVTQVTPTSGPMSGGTQVSITGRNLDVIDSVSFDGVDTVPVTYASDMQLLVVSPPVRGYSPVPGLTYRPIRHVAALSLNGDGQSFRTGVGFTYLDAEPVLTQVTPPTGPDTGGTRVTLTGENLDLVTRVGLAQSGEATIISATADRIVIETPPHRPAGLPSEMPQLSEPFILESMVGTVRTTAAFTYLRTPPEVTALAPDNGPLAGGTEVAITGNYLGNVREVTFGSAGAGSILTASEKRIVVQSPPHRPVPEDAAEPISLTMAWPDAPGGTKVFATGKEFTYQIPDPVIYDVAPSQGPLTGGTEVTITGRNLDQITSVTFGSRTASIRGSTDTRIDVTAPPGTNAGPVRITVRTATGVDREPAAFTYLPDPSTSVTPSPSRATPSSSPSGTPTPSPSPRPTNSGPEDRPEDDDMVVVSGMSPASGPIGGGTTVTITGSNLMAVSSVRFGPAGAAIQAQSANRLVVTAPGAAAAYSVNVLLTHPKGVVEAGSFAYLP